MFYSLLITTLREAIRLWLNGNAKSIKVFKERQRVYCSAIADKSIPDSLQNSETQASCYHLKRTHITGSYELELWPLIDQH